MAASLLNHFESLFSSCAQQAFFMLSCPRPGKVREGQGARIISLLGEIKRSSQFELRAYLCDASALVFAAKEGQGRPRKADAYSRCNHLS